MEVDFENVVLDDVEEPTGESQEETIQQGEQQAAPPEAEKEEAKADDTKQAEAPKVKLKYNHEEKEYSLDEVVPLAQKGMNYDKVIEQMETLKNDPRLTKAERLEQLAQLYDMEDNAFIDALFDQFANNMAEQENITKEQAKAKIEKKFDLDNREKQLKKEKEEIDKVKQEQAQKDADTKEFNHFIEDYPDIKTDDIPKEVWERSNTKGETLSQAMMWYENQKLKEEVKTLKQNEENAKKAPINGTTQYGTGKAEPIDPFLEGFNSV